MVSRFLLFAAISMGVVAWVGCSNGVEERTIKVKSPALEEARGILERYSKGAPLGSEMDSIPQLIERVKEVDPDKAALLEQTFNKIKDSPRSRAAIAAGTLKKL